MTIDKDLVFFKIKDGENNFIVRIFEKDMIILELKYSEKEDDEISIITKEFPFRMTAISKYVYGINALS